MFRVFHIAHNRKIYGPGNRDVVWFQGCHFHCKNCINKNLWAFNEGDSYDSDSLVKKIKTKEVTLLGGEPLDQENILDFIQALKQKDIGIILFTGYEEVELSGNLYKAAKLCDAVIYGRYVDELKDDSLYLRGSRNQMIVLNTERYSKEDFEKPNSFEIDIDEDIESCGRSNNFVKELLDLN